MGRQASHGGGKLIETLKVQDLALVDSLAVEFSGGFNVLTGETGAGKSILLQALSLLLGDRASREMVRSGARGARVEGVFAPKAKSALLIGEILDGAGIAREESLIIARTVSDDGKSRAFVNGAAVPVSLLAEIGAKLVEVSSQHQHQALLDEGKHLSILDAALDEEGRASLERYRALFADFE
ncbi:DNA repair protein RecN, partial [bacterium]